MPADRTVCRFAVGSREGRRSPSFRVWTAKNHPDFYVSARTVASVFKATIHAPRPERGLAQEGHAATTAQFFEKAIREGKANGTSRFGGTWSGREVQPGIWLQLHVMVPAYGLRSFSEFGAPKPMKWIAAPADHQMAIVSVFTVGGHVVSRTSDSVLGSAELCDGRKVVVTGHYRDAPPATEFARLFRAGAARVPVSQDELRDPAARLIISATGDNVGALIDVPADLLIATG